MGTCGPICVLNTMNIFPGHVWADLQYLTLYGVCELFPGFFFFFSFFLPAGTHSTRTIGDTRTSTRHRAVPGIMCAWCVGGRCGWGGVNTAHTRRKGGPSPLSPLYAQPLPSASLSASKYFDRFAGELRVLTASRVGESARSADWGTRRERPRTSRVSSSPRNPVWTRAPVKALF